LPTIFTPSLHRVVLFTTSSISTKASSPDPEERAGIAAYARAERDVTTCCDGLGVTRTVLRPTIIYDEGKDNNLTRIARLIARLGFFPLCGRGLGLRQPVHAEDCAIAAVNAAQSIRAENKIYELPGGETITYREMIGEMLSAGGYAIQRGFNLHDTFVELVKEGVARGEVSTRHDAETLADIIVGALSGGILNWTEDRTYSLPTNLHNLGVALAELLTAPAQGVARPSTRRKAAN